MYVSFHRGLAENPEGRAVIDWLKRVLKMPPWFGKEFLPANSLGTDDLAATDTRILAAISELGADRNLGTTSQHTEEQALYQARAATN